MRQEYIGEGADLGFIEPVEGRWLWPFKRLERGDFFKVAPEHREFHKMRSLAYNSAAKLGIKVQVRLADEGHTVVRRCDGLVVDKTELELIRYRALDRRLRYLYGVEASAIPFEQALFEGEQFFPARRRPSAQDQLFEAEVGKNFYRVHFGKDGIRWRPAIEPLSLLED